MFLQSYWPAMKVNSEIMCGSRRGDCWCFFHTAIGSTAAFQGAVDRAHDIAILIFGETQMAFATDSLELGD